MGNILDGRLSLDNLKYLPVEHEEFPGLLLEPGDVLFNRTNSADLVGKTAVYRGTPSPCSFASYLIRIRLLDGIQPELVAYYINSSHGRAWIASVVTQQVGQANVNGTKLQALAIPIPPAPEQARIVAEVESHLSRIDAGLASLERAGIKLNRFRNAVLKAACEGRLVPTEAELARVEGRDYEPADRLLDRRTRSERLFEHLSKPTEDLRLPEGWSRAQMSDLLREPLRNGHSSKATNNPEGIRTLTLTAVTTGNGSPTRSWHGLTDDLS